MSATAALVLYAAFALLSALLMTREGVAGGPLFAFGTGGLLFLAAAASHLACWSLLRGRRLGRRLALAEAELLSLRQAAAVALPQVSLQVEETAPAAAAPPRLEGLSGEAVLALLREALSEDRIDLAVQPIVTLPQRRLRYFECYTRLRDAAGAELLPQDYIAIAAREGLVTAIDNILLLRALQLSRNARRRNRELGFFCNLSPATLADAEFFRDVVDYLTELPELAESLVLEFAEADLGRLSVAAQELTRLRALGLRFSLDHLSDLALEPDHLARRGFRFVKLEAASAERLIDEEGSEALSALLRRFADSGIEVILERVESEESLRELLDYGFALGQGFLLGPPQLPRAGL